MVVKPYLVAMSAALLNLVAFSAGQAETVAAAQPDAVRLQLARDVLAASGGASAMEARMRGAFAGINKLTADALPNEDPKAMKLTQSVWKYMADEEIKAIPQLLDQTAALYADNLSEQELRDLLAWSLSPSGKALQAKLPLISQELMASQGPLMKKIMSGVAATAVDHVCSDNNCSDDQRKTMIAIVQKAVPAS